MMMVLFAKGVGCGVGERGGELGAEEVEGIHFRGGLARSAKQAQQIRRTEEALTARIFDCLVSGGYTLSKGSL